MSIVIFGDLFTFPEGNAATNRAYTYAKGFFENGYAAHVICSANQYNSPGDGALNGIHYYNPFGQLNRSNWFIVRRWKVILKYFKTLKLIRSINNKDKITAIIVYTDALSTHLFAWYLSKICTTKLIKESCEHPLYLHIKNVKRGHGLIKFKIETFLCDGVICISQFLVDYYSSHGFSQNKLILIPSTVDPNLFSQNTEKPLPYSYIGYFGGLTIKRDNVDILIRAFSMISEKHPDLHLVLGGFGPESERELIRRLIQNYKISLKVELLKYLTRNEIIRYITHSKVLVMVRGNGLAAHASFPSKLTEYLSTSKPVVTVNVGEISHYLTDKLNSFLIEPGRYDQLAEKLDYVLNNYELALKIAQRGKELTSTTFNYNYQAGRIIEFVQSI